MGRREPRCRPRRADEPRQAPQAADIAPGRPAARAFRPGAGASTVAVMAGPNAEGREPSAGSLARALEAEARRLAAERLELAERMEREMADLRAGSDARVAAERDRAERLEAELAEARSALAELQRSRDLRDRPDAPRLLSAARAAVTPSAFAPAGSARVSVVMATHDAWGWIERSLAALAEHTPPVYEVIVVDNASSPATIDHLTGDVAGIRLIRNAENRGFGPANNQGAAEARGEILALLNSDLLVHAGWLGPLLARLDADPACGAVAPRVLNVDGTLQEAGAILARDGTAAKHGDGAVRRRSRVPVRAPDRLRRRGVPAGPSRGVRGGGRLRRRLRPPTTRTRTSAWPSPRGAWRPSTSRGRSSHTGATAPAMRRRPTRSARAIASPSWNAGAVRCKRGRSRSPRRGRARSWGPATRSHSTGSCSRAPARALTRSCGGSPACGPMRASPSCSRIPTRPATGSMPCLHRASRPSPLSMIPRPGSATARFRLRRRGRRRRGRGHLGGDAAAGAPALPRRPAQRRRRPATGTRPQRGAGRGQHRARHVEERLSQARQSPSARRPARRRPRRAARSSRR